MKLNSKLTGGLAWAGLIVVLAVPSADLLTGKESADSVKSVATPSTAVQTASVAPSPQPTIKRVAGSKSDDPVDAFVQSGKKLPSYISDAPDAAAKEPAPTHKLVVPSQTSPQAVDLVTVASVPSTEAAPIPYPASMRPAERTTAVATTTPPVATTTIAAPATGLSPSGGTSVAATTEEAPLIIDDELVERREEAVAKVLDEEPRVAITQPPQRIEEDQLEEWDSGSLAEYLERKGLISNNREQASNSNFDEDGFVLDEGPNEERSEARVIRRIKRNDDFFF
jgi:hypothetical protein